MVYITKYDEFSITKKLNNDNWWFLQGNVKNMELSSPNIIINKYKYTKVLVLTGFYLESPVLVIVSIHDLSPKSSIMLSN